MTQVGNFGLGWRPKETLGYIVNTA